MLHPHGGLGVHIYPDPPATAITVAPGATALVSLSHGELRSNDSPPNMYVRAVSIETVTTESLLLRAGNGDPVAMGPATKAIFDAPGSTGNYVADALLTDEPNGARVIRLFLYLATPSAWTLSIVNSDAAARSFEVVVSEANPSRLAPGFDPQQPLSVTSAPWDTPLTLNGTFFDQPGLSVAMGTAPVQVQSKTAHQIVVDVPRIKGGAYTVEVTTGMGRALSPALFTVIEPPSPSP